MADLRISVAGLDFKNPVLPASGPVVGTGERLASIAKSGVGGLVTHTISLLPAPRPPSPVKIRGGMLHLPTWSQYPMERWVSEFLPQARAAADIAGIPLVVSVGFNAEEVDQVIPKVAPFADGLELSSQFLRPGGGAMSDAATVIREVTSRHGNPIAKDPAPLRDAVQAAKGAFSGPVFVKLTSMGPEVADVAKAAEAAGADGIVTIHSFGPVMTIDIERAKPSFASDDGHAWIGGTAVRALALRNVFDIARTVGIPVIGAGGVASAADAVEFLMSGASAVQASTEAMRRGPKFYRSLAKKLDKWLDAHSYVGVGEITGLGVRNWRRLEPHTYTVPPIYNPDECIGCTLCELSCHYHAIWMEKEKAVFDPDLCFGCGLCTVRCPTDALTMPPMLASEGVYQRKGHAF